MKHFIAVAALVFAAVSLDAQVALHEPEFNDVFARLDAGNLVTLERQTPATQLKSSGFIAVNMKSLWEIQGTKSTVRFHSNQPLDFVVRSNFAGTAGGDPNTIFTLHRLDVKKKTRELVMTAVHGTLSRATANSNPQGTLPVSFSRYGDQSVKVTTSILPPGEYALRSLYTETVFCFGID